MPELPEVESLRQLLAASVTGRTIKVAQVRERRLRRTLAADFSTLISDRTIGAIQRRAKYLLIELSRNATLVVHLGMSGSLTHRGQDFCDADFDPAHDHLRMALDDGSALVYNDPRRFGLLKLVMSSQLNQIEELKDLGPEPLSSNFNAPYLAQAARGKKLAIKNLLMDQRVVAGVGNIYASEILFRARVRPGRAAGRVTRQELDRIVEATPFILRQAIGVGGTTFRSYRDSNGKPGAFASRLQVYGREDQPCLVCQTPVRNRVIGQRASFYCPKCQR